MGASADAPAPEREAINDADDWRDLSVEEQRAVLDEAEVTEDGEDDVADWDTLDSPTQEDTLAAIEQSLSETWMAYAFEDVEDTTTIPFEVFQLSEGQQEEVLDRVQLIAQVEQSGAESVDELGESLDMGDDEVLDLFDSLEEIEMWLDEFLADITAGDQFDREWWADHSNYPAGTRMALFMELVGRYQSRVGGAQSFRPESRGGGPG